MLLYDLNAAAHHINHEVENRFRPPVGTLASFHHQQLVRAMQLVSIDSFRAGNVVLQCEAVVDRHAQWFVDPAWRTHDDSHGGKHDPVGRRQARIVMEQGRRCV